MKYAVVTGGTKGIGKAIVSALLNRGYFVYLTYSSDKNAVLSFEQEFIHFEDKYRIDQVNQARLDEMEKYTQFVLDNTPKIDCIVCNAGATARKKFKDLTLADWDLVLNVSLNAHFILIRNLFDHISADARILFIGSMMGVHPHATSLPYGVSKAAVHALAKNLVKEFEGTNTTVNAIVPGFVETEWQKDKPLEIRNNILEKSAVKRFAYTQEIANACLFCVDNAFVNGSLLEISGGYAFK